MRERLLWVDVARGVALTAVVVHHALLLTANALPANQTLLQIDLALDGFRMPTLVALSGVLAVSVRDMSWADVWRRRVAPLLVFYTAWAVVLAVLNSAILGDPQAQVRTLLLMYVSPIADLWYLFALLVYLAASRATRAVPTWILVSIALIVFVVTRVWWDDARAALGTWAWILAHWLYFVCAQRFATHYFRMAGAATTPRATVALLCFTGLAAVALWTGVVASVGALLVLSFAGTIVGFMCASAWVDARWLSWTRTIGVLSLGVYALHLAIVRAVWLAIEGSLPIFPGGGVVIPLAIAAVALVSSAIVTAALRKWAPVPLLRVWWDTASREFGREQRNPQPQAQ